MTAYKLASDIYLKNFIADLDHKIPFVQISYGIITYINLTKDNNINYADIIRDTSKLLRNII